MNSRFIEAILFPTAEIFDLYRWRVRLIDKTCTILNDMIYTPKLDYRNKLSDEIRKQIVGTEEPNIPVYFFIQFCGKTIKLERDDE